RAVGADHLLRVQLFALSALLDFELHARRVGRHAKEAGIEEERRSGLPGLSRERGNQSSTLDDQIGLTQSDLRGTAISEQLKSVNFVANAGGGIAIHLAVEMVSDDEGTRSGIEIGPRVENADAAAALGEPGSGIQSGGGSTDDDDFPAFPFVQRLLKWFVHSLERSSARARRTLRFELFLSRVRTNVLGQDTATGQSANSERAVRFSIANQESRAKLERNPREAVQDCAAGLMDCRSEGARSSRKTPIRAATRANPPMSAAPEDGRRMTSTPAAPPIPPRRYMPMTAPRWPSPRFARRCAAWSFPGV